MNYGEKWYEKLQRKIGRIYISNLMNIIITVMAVVFVVEKLFISVSEFPLSLTLAFDRAAILSGQFWKIITFIFIPPESSPIFIIFSLYLYWLIGNALESYWGPFKFNLFYFTGVIGTIIAGFITGYATNYYLNMSLFLAFALIYPNFELNLFMLIPIKMKYLALIDAISLLLAFFTSSISGKAAITATIVNIIIFFGTDFINMIKNFKRRRDFRNNWRN